VGQGRIRRSVVGEGGESGCSGAAYFRQDQVDGWSHRSGIEKSCWCQIERRGEIEQSDCGSDSCSAERHSRVGRWSGSEAATARVRVVSAAAGARAAWEATAIGVNPRIREKERERENEGIVAYGVGSGGVGGASERSGVHFFTFYTEKIYLLL
jgi:hypothetical protein